MSLRYSTLWKLTDGLWFSSSLVIVSNSFITARVSAFTCRWDNSSFCLRLSSRLSQLPELYAAIERSVDLLSFFRFSELSVIDSTPFSLCLGRSSELGKEWLFTGLVFRSPNITAGRLWRILLTVFSCLHLVSVRPEISATELVNAAIKGGYLIGQLVGNIKFLVIHFSKLQIWKRLSGYLSLV